ncbi:hypothetical protein D048_0797 [Vibrio parahaemolyticus VPTS-2009]|nr:hypothetical protein D048_0797 [Vibrio parahaemolyticus VPTS-2009]
MAKSRILAPAYSNNIGFDEAFLFERSKVYRSVNRAVD